MEKIPKECVARVRNVIVIGAIGSGKSAFLTEFYMKRKKGGPR